ncbi:hypothetical protein PIB30_021500 [Stylosanthes scabra]|uniref:DUF4283 domain-containing protein n=1 Tax=Stylosanthes scabra TaxID=79078 RepID=A0ABU6Z8C5_9FABA|nr:hypothetical protein [Stylosanthes scabra]
MEEFTADDSSIMEEFIAEDGDSIFIDPLPKRGCNMNNYNLVGKEYSFKDHEKGEQTLNRGPWSIRGNLLNLKKWTGKTLQSVNHNKMELWMQMHGVPLSHRARTISVLIGGSFGKVLEAEESVINNILHRSFLRAKMDITRPLPTGMWLNRPNLPRVWNLSTMKESKIATV